MFITSRFPSLGFDQFWISPPEYFEFTEWNRSFSRVGAFTTGELNLSASDRPTAGADGQRGRRAAEDAGRAGRPAAGISRQRRRARAAPTSRCCRTRPGRRCLAAGRSSARPSASTADRGRSSASCRRASTSWTTRSRCGCPCAWTQSNRSNRGNHGLYLIGRLADGRSMSEAQAENQHVASPVGKNSSRKPTSPAPTFTSSRWSPHRPRSSAAPRAPSGSCRQRSASCCSSPARTSPTCCSRGPRPGTASLPCAPRLARAGGGCSASS